MTGSSFHEADVLVIGAGIAGLSTAITCADAGLNVTVVCTTESLLECNTAWAQGGVIYQGFGDSMASLEKDIWEAGCRKGYWPAIHQLAKWGPKCVEEFLLGRLCVPFDKKEDGELDLTSEGAHSLPRIVHVKDATGKSIQAHFQKAVSHHPRIKLLFSHTAIDLLTTSHNSPDAQSIYLPTVCLGAYVYDAAIKQVKTILARETVLATGGLGGLYLHSTNHIAARGDGIAMAYRAGARLINMEYIQFHPTGLYHPEKPRFLISESLRGEGAVLINHLGQEFMEQYHPLKNLAPRDVVTRAIDDEMTKYQIPCVYLDMKKSDAAWIKKRFPMIHQKCLEYGYDLTRSPVPVVPVAHYTCGGILVDLEGRSSLQRLRAVGEVSCTGVHGANRLASTSLLEGLVWGILSAKSIVKDSPGSYEIPEVLPWQYENEPIDLSLIHQDWMTLRNTMWNYVGPTRSSKRLARAHIILRNLRHEVEEFYNHAELSDELIGLRNGIEAAWVVLIHAINNKHSVGSHFYQKED